MRISDWSSDVCSSDLRAPPPLRQDRDPPRPQDGPCDAAQTAAGLGVARDRPPAEPGAPVLGHAHLAEKIVLFLGKPCRILPGPNVVAFDDRSEEHTSELQSLMRISYDVFCLKKKTTQQ